jgi:hypothetical protein
MSTECTITAWYIFFSIYIDHSLGHKASLKKYKKIEITAHIVSGHKAMKLQLNKISSKKRCRQLKVEQHIAQ